MPRATTAASPLARAARWAALPVALMVTAAVMWHASYAAFTTSTANPTNNWDTGTVVLADDDTGTAMFDATGLKPGSTLSRCIVVTYSGSLAAAVRLYGTGDSATNSLDTWL